MKAIISITTFIILGAFTLSRAAPYPDTQSICFILSNGKLITKSKCIIHSGAGAGANWESVKINGKEYSSETSTSDGSIFFQEKKGIKTLRDGKTLKLVKSPANQKGILSCYASLDWKTELCIDRSATISLTPVQNNETICMPTPGARRGYMVNGLVPFPNGMDDVIIREECGLKYRLMKAGFSETNSNSSNYWFEMFELKGDINSLKTHFLESLKEKGFATKSRDQEKTAGVIYTIYKLSNTKINKDIYVAFESGFNKNYVAFIGKK